jgi:hypothetical protein
MLTPRVVLLYPFRQSCAIIGTTFKARVPKLGFDILIRPTNLDAKGRIIKGNGPLQSLFPGLPISKPEQYIESTYYDSGVAIIKTYRRKQ